MRVSQSGTVSQALHGQTVSNTSNCGRFIERPRSFMASFGGAPRIAKAARKQLGRCTREDTRSGKTANATPGTAYWYLIALVATGGAIWSYTSTRTLLQSEGGRELSLYDADRRQRRIRACRGCRRDRAAAESWLRNRVQMREAQKAKDAAEGSSQETTDGLAAAKTAKEAARGYLKEDKTQLTELQEAKEAAEPRRGVKGEGGPRVQERVAHEKAAPVAPDATPRPPSQ